MAVSGGLRRTITIKNAVIKGYHAFKIRPPLLDPPTRLKVDREYLNLEDVNSMLVWIPPLETFHQSFHNIVTDASRNLKLCDIADLPMGHVPRGLAGVFRQFMDQSDAEIVAIPKGLPCDSFPPWPPKAAKGGGVVVPAEYEISVADDKYNEYKTLLSSAIQLMAERHVLEIV